MVGDAGPERVVHGLCHTMLYRQFVTFRQTFETRDTGVTVPGSQAQGIEMVDAVRDAEPLHQGFEPDAAGNDEDQGIGAKPLNDTAQPTQELVDPLGAVVLTEHALEEYRQFVDDEEDRLVVPGTVADEPLTVVTPVAGAQTGANPDAKVECANLLDVLREPALHRGCEARRDRSDRMHRLCDVGDHILCAGRALDIGEEEDPSLGLEPSPKLSSDAGLSHAALAGQQCVVAGANPRIQNLQLGLAIEEVVAAHPAASGQFHTHFHSR